MIMAFLILFGNTQPSINRKDYVQKKLNSFFNNSENQQENANIVCSVNPVVLEMLEKENFPKLTVEQEKNIRDAEACFLKEINGRWKLEENEKLVDSLVSYSISMYSCLTPGTPVARFTTNYGIVYFAQSDTVISQGVLQKRIVVDPVNYNNQLMVIPVLAELLVNFAKSIASTLGTQLIKEIFGIGKEIDTKELCNELALIVKDANANQTVQECSGNINGTLKKLTVTYENEKQARPEPRTEKQKEYLCCLLDKMKDELLDHLSILEQEDFKRKGISVLIFGTNILFAVLKEKSFIEKGNDYKTSPSYKSYIQFLKSYINFVKATRNLITQERLNCIKKIYFKQHCVYSPPGEVYCTDQWHYEDSFIRKTYDFKDRKEGSKRYSGLDLANQSRNNAIKEVKDRLNWIDDVVMGWQEALDKA